MTWFPCEYHPVPGRQNKRRTIAWASSTNRRVRVRHCGHPTANMPYYLEIDGQEAMQHGTFRLLAQAQRAADELTL